MTCIICGDDTNNIYDICFRCLPNKIDRNCCCELCSYPTSKYVKKCSRCMEMPPLFRNYSLFYYTFNNRYIHRLYKFNSHKAIAHYFYIELHRFLKNLNIDFIIQFIPSSTIKRLLKGWYHLNPIRSMMLKHGYQVVNILEKKFKNDQKKLNTEARSENIKDAFIVKRNKQDRSKQLILIDDVYTTGATMDEACKVLKNEGFQNILTLTLYRD